MNARILGALLPALLFFDGILNAQNKPVPELAVLQAQFNVQTKAVTAPYETGLAQLNERYTAALDRAITTTTQSGRLNEVLPFTKDKERHEKGDPMPEKDDAATPPMLKQIRGTYRTGLAKLTADRDIRMKPLADAYGRSLTAMVAALTKAGRVEEAKYVEQQRFALGEPFRQYKGTWEVSYSNGVRGKRYYRINAAGKVEDLSGDKVLQTFQLYLRGKDVLLDCAEGKVERLWMKDGLLHLGHYNPKTLYPKDEPSHLGTTVKLVD